MDEKDEETFEIIDDEELVDDKEDNKKDDKLLKNVVTPAATIGKASSLSKQSLNNNTEPQEKTSNSKNLTSSPSTLPSTSKNISTKVNNAAKKLQDLRTTKNVSNHHLPSNNSGRSEKKSQNQDNIQDGGNESLNNQNSEKNNKEKSNNLISKNGIEDKKSSIGQNLGTAAKSAANLAAGNKLKGAVEATSLFEKPIKKMGKKFIILAILGFFSIIIIICSIVGTDNIERVMDILNTMNKVEDMIDEFFYHKNTNSNSEEYSNSCIGAISPALISELSLPVKINSDNVTFTGEYAYGITTAQMHNGVDLNLETTGTNEGDDIYAIADGEVVDIVSNVSCNKESDGNCDSKGSWIKLKHSILIDDTTYDFYSVYMNMQANSSVLKKGDKVNKDDVIGKVGKTGDANIAQVHFEFHNENDTPIDPTNLFIPCTSGQLVGDSVEEQIWFYFRNQGYSEAATAGAMGNLQAESGLEPRRVQGDIPFSEYSINYTTQVDNKTISKSDFIKNGPNGGGYGLAQWTSSGRKENLYKYKEKNNSSIGDLQTQLEYLMTEVSGPGWNSTSKHNLWENSSGDSGVNDAADAYCEAFERPAKCNYADRRKNAQAIYDRNKGKSFSTSSVYSSGSNKILASAEEIKKYIANNGYSYSKTSSKIVPSYSIRIVDCSSYVSWVLYNAGYSQFGGSQASSVTFLNNKWGFKEVSKSDIQPGDILVYNGHVEIYVGMNGNKIRVYNAGSNSSIRNPGITESAKTLGSIRKILRP